MNLRHKEKELSKADEQQLVDSIRALAGQPQSNDRSASYWASLIVRTNRRVDEETSGKAISIGWAARVAIPGIVAIISFFVGLQYFFPGSGANEPPLISVVREVPAETLDSLLIARTTFDESVDQGELVSDPFDVSKEQIVEYMATHGNANVLLETMSDEQVGEVLAVLDTR